MVLRPQGQALRLTTAYSHLSSMVMAEKLSPRLGLGLGPELKLLVSYGGYFGQDVYGKWIYKGGTRYIDSVRVNMTYTEVAFRWSEKVNSDLLELKYKLPEDDLDPDQLITVRDDTDLQEMIKEYFGGVAKSKAAACSRLSVYLFFDLNQEPLTPAEYQDGCSFFRTSSMSRLGGSNGTSNVQASSLGSNTSMESAKTAAAAQRDPQQLPDDSEQAREAAALVEWIHEQESKRDTPRTREDELGMFTLEDSAFLPSEPSEPSTAGVLGVAEKPAYRTQDKLILEQLASSWQPRYCVSGHDDDGQCATRYARPARPEDQAADMEVRMAEEFPPLPSQLFGSPAQDTLPYLSVIKASQQGFHLPSDVSDFGKGHTLDLAYIMEERRHELAYLHREQQAARAAAAAGPGQLSIQPVVPPGMMVAAHGAVVPAKDGSMRQGSVGLEAQASGTLASSLLSHVHRVPLSGVRHLADLGCGTFGNVWLGHNSTFGKVAVKTVKPGKEAGSAHSFWKEAEMLASLNHPNVLRVYGVVVADVPVGLASFGSLGSPGSPVDRPVVGIMTEYMRGGSLSAHLAQLALMRDQLPQGKMPLKLRAELALHAVKGLAYLHDMNVVHFDLKPENLLLDGPLFPLDTKCPAPVVKVADFGLSKHKLKYHVPDVLNLRGTLPYMAPELATNSLAVSEKVDVWSLGVVLWEMLTLQTPFADYSPQEILAGLMSSRAPLIPSNCEPEWGHLLERCWEPIPQNRCSLRDLAESLQRIIDEIEVEQQMGGMGAMTQWGFPLVGQVAL